MILSSLPESVVDDKVAKVLLKNVPELEGQVRASHRLGRPIPTPTPGGCPRLVKIELTSQGKYQLWKHQQQLEHGESPLYVNNGLSRQERVRRKAILPKYKALLAAGVRCTLPYDCIYQDDKPIDPAVVGNA